MGLNKYTNTTSLKFAPLQRIKASFLVRLLIMLVAGKTLVFSFTANLVDYRLILTRKQKQ
jgi:hypothetical protein